MGEGVKGVHVAQMKSMKYVQEPDSASHERPTVQEQCARQKQLLQAAVTLVAVPPGIAFIDHEISSSLVAACLLPWLRSLPLSLYEHLEGWAVNQALRAVLLNNYLLSKEHAFNLDFFHLVISAILPTAVSAQWKQQASFQEQNQNCKVETPSLVSQVSCWTIPGRWAGAN